MPQTASLPARAIEHLWEARSLGEPGSDGFHRSWIMLFPEGKFDHPEYGHLAFTHARLAQIKRLFDRRVRHIDVALDANHDQDKATGWFERLELREGSGDTPTGLWGLVRWTPLGVRYLRDQIYRYFSPEFGPWRDPETGEEYKDVLLGGGLTNRPFLKSMPAVQLAEKATKAASEQSRRRGNEEKRMTRKHEHTHDGDERDLLLADGADDEDDTGTQAFADDSEEYDDGEDEGGAAMDDAEDAADGGADDAEEVDGGEDTHGPVTVKGHSHGKYGRHSHAGDGDHSEAPLKDLKESGDKQMSGGAKKASEGVRGMSLAEMRSELMRLREENAQVAYKLYEAEVGKTLEGWGRQQFQFAEGGRKKAGAIAMSKVFADKYRAFMLREGVRLSPAQRREVSALVEGALSTAIVDLSERGSSYDQEARRTRRPGEAAGTDRVEETALRLAQQDGLVPEGVALSEARAKLAHLDREKQLDLYRRAHKLAGE